MIPAPARAGGRLAGVAAEREPVRVAVAGVGRLGAAHARLLAEIQGAHLVGVLDPDRARAASVAAKTGSRDFGEADALFGEVDAVVVAAPTPEHHAVASAALAAGCHVLVEKPVAATLEEADGLIETAGRVGRFLAVGHVERFNPAVRACRPHLRDPRYLESRRLAPFQDRGTDVPVMLDLMIHDIDLVLGLVGAAVAEVHAIGVPVLTDSVDIANARITFDNGAVADISSSRVSLDRSRRLRVFQPSGYFSLDLAQGTAEHLRRRDGVSTAAGDRERTLADLVERMELGVDGAEPLRLELEAFLRAVRGEPSDSVPATEGRAALEVALRIGREIEAGR